MYLLQYIAMMQNNACKKLLRTIKYNAKDGKPADEINVINLGTEIAMN